MVKSEWEIIETACYPNKHKIQLVGNFVRSNGSCYFFPTIEKALEAISKLEGR